MAMKLLTTNPDSTDVASISFTSGIDSTYKLYVFKFYDCNPATDSAEFSFQCSTDGGSNYNTTITSSAFYAYHDEADSATTLVYSVTQDLAQGTAFMDIGYNIGSDADASIAGEIFLFNPSNTTYVKHFYGTLQEYHSSDMSFITYFGGYVNSTSAVNAVSFKMNTGNMDGVIKMYRVG